LDLSYFRPGSFARNSEVKYTVNLANAKSRFRFSCPNEQCVAGDYDLSTALARAVAAHQTTIAGEVVCQGWRCQAAIGEVRCHHMLRYKIRAKYARYKPPAEPEQTGTPEVLASRDHRILSRK
jgi:hypothetical protein